MNWLEYHEKPVTLHSGGTSHWLVRGELMFEDERLRESVLSFWVEYLKHWQPRVHVVGIPTGGTPWAEALKERVELDEIDGPVVLVDDVVTTGKSMKEAAPKFRTVIARLCVVDRGPSHGIYGLSVQSWAHLPGLEPAE